MSTDLLALPGTVAPTRLYEPLNLRGALKDAVANKKVLWGVGQSINHNDSAHILALLGADFAFIDCEHGAWDLAQMRHSIQTFNATGKTGVIVRIPNIDSPLLNVALDAGASGIMLPHTETVEEVEKLVSLCRFPKQGVRSISPWIYYGPNNLPAVCDLHNEKILVIPQVESPKGVENLEAILKVPGIDGIMIGYGDLRLTSHIGIMGTEGFYGGEEPEWLSLKARVQKTVKASGIPAMGFAFPGTVARMIDDGFYCLMAVPDSMVIAQAGSAMLAGVKEEEAVHRGKSTNGSVHVEGQ